MTSISVFKNSKTIKVLCIAASVGLVAYFISISSFFLDNHYLRMPWVDPMFQVSRGNWTHPFFSFLFYFANIPVLAPLISILALAVAGIILVYIFDDDPSFFSLACCTIFIVVFPYQLAVFFYTYQTYMFSFSQLFAVAAIAITRNARIRYLLLGAAATFLSVATYQPAISIVITVFLGALVVDFYRLRVNKTWQKMVIRQATAIFIGIACYKLSLIFVTDKRVESIVKLSDMISRGKLVLISCFKTLCYSQPELLLQTKIILLIAVAFALMQTIRMSSKQNKTVGILGVIFFLLLVVSPKTLYFFYDTRALYAYRYNLSYAYFYAVAIYIMSSFVKISKTNYNKYIIIASLFFIVLRFVEADLVRQHIQLRGEQHDLAFLNRISMRIEELNTIDRNKYYKLVLWGNIPLFRPKIYNASGHKAALPGGEHFDSPIVMGWNPEQAMLLLGTSVKFSPLLPVRQLCEEKVRKELSKGTHKPWPDESSVFNLEDIIVVYMRKTPGL